MNIKTLTIFAAFILLLPACSDDDSTPPTKEFSFGENTLALKEANLYLTYEDEYEEHTYLEYTITDGTYSDEEDDIIDYTYEIYVYLAVPVDNDFAAGEYPQWYPEDWAEASDDNVSYTDGWTILNNEVAWFWTDEEENEHAPVVVSGGFEEGETITLEFEGNLTYGYYDDNEDWIEETVSSSLYFKGDIVDIRETGAKTRSSESHPAFVRKGRAAFH